MTAARPEPSPVLTARELNRALLARQMLLERAADLPVPKALDRMGGLQAQYAPSMYVGLWSRLAGFARPQLDDALRERTAVQGTLMRITIHLVSTGDYWPMALAVRAARRPHWLRAAAHKPDASTVEVAAGRLRKRLRDGPMRRAEVGELVGAENVIGVGLWLDLVRVPPSGTWDRRRADLFGAAEDWIGPPPAGLTVESAQDHLVRRYLTGFGPSTVAEVADWAGLVPRDVAPILDRLYLLRFRAEDGSELFDLPDAPRPDPTVAAPVRFLPTWDAVLLAHARRKAVLAEEIRSRIFSTRTPHSVGTFLVDGAVAGTWRYDRGRVQVDPFEPLSKATRREVDDEAAGLTALYG